MTCSLRKVTGDAEGGREEAQPCQSELGALEGFLGVTSELGIVGGI